MRITYVIFVLFVLSVGNAVAGYSIHVAPQIPEFVTVNGPYGPETWPNTERPPVYPATYGNLVCRPEPYSSFSADPAQRTRVFSDTAGTATDADVFAACPQLKNRISDEIKAIRKTALNRFVIDAGVLAVYQENYSAAATYKQPGGPLTIVKDGKTAEQYLSGLGSQMTPPMTADQFADYILGENRRVGTTAYQVEQQYLWFVYTVIPTELYVDELLDLPNQYRRYCGL